MTILDLPDDILIDIARRVFLPRSMEAINKKFRKLKVAEYQPVCYWGNNTMSIQRVFNQKRSFLGITAPRYPDMRTSLLNEFETNRSLTDIDLSTIVLVIWAPSTWLEAS